MDNRKIKLETVAKMEKPGSQARKQDEALAKVAGDAKELLNAILDAGGSA
jgi:hypothetical protein